MDLMNMDLDPNGSKKSISTLKSIIYLRIAFLTLDMS